MIKCTFWSFLFSKKALRQVMIAAKLLSALKVEDDCLENSGSLRGDFSLFFPLR